LWQPYVSPSAINEFNYQAFTMPSYYLKRRKQTKWVIFWQKNKKRTHDGLSRNQRIRH
jgi:hypothetical protein